MIGRVRTWLSRGGTAQLAEIAVNFVLPYIIYDRLSAPWGDTRALLASSAPPILWSLAEFARHRRVDALSMIVLGGIALSLLAMLGGGSARFLQLRENMVSAVIGLVFLGSAAIGKPLIYQLARAGLARRTPDELAGFEARRERPGFRRVMLIMTLVWGTGLTASALMACALVMTLSIRTYMIVGPVQSYAVMGALTLWTAWYARRAERRGRAAAAAATQTSASA